MKFFSSAAALLLFSSVIIVSCTKNDIQFGTQLGESYIKVNRIDSLRPVLSTYVFDSFSTYKPSAFFAGRYHDPELGLISAKAAFQVSAPGIVDVGNDAVFDSMTVVLRLNKVYYGDTSKYQRITISELSDPITYSYADQLYNTTSITEKSPALGMLTTRIRPNTDDSIEIKLNAAKGLELFTKIKQQSNDVLSQDAFLSYLKGLSVSFPTDDSALVFGFKDSVCLRLHYHNTLPYPEPHWIDMETYLGGLYFNQILSPRTGTLLGAALAGGQKIATSASTGGVAYTQGSAGIMLKVNFPGLRNVFQSDTSARLLSATLVLKAAPGSYDQYRLRLPPSLFLTSTDGSNNIGGEIAGYDGQVMKVGPVTDYIYQTPAYYSFDISNYVSNIISNTTTDDFALFVIGNYAGDSDDISRMVFSNATDLNSGSQVILSFLTVKK